MVKETDPAQLQTRARSMARSMMSWIGTSESNEMKLCDDHQAHLASNEDELEDWESKNEGKTETARVLMAIGLFNELGRDVATDVKMRFDAVNGDAPIYPTKKGETLWLMKDERGGSIHTLQEAKIGRAQGRRCSRKCSRGALLWARR